MRTKLFLKAGKPDIPVKEANENDKVVHDVKRERVETDDSTRLPTLHDIVAINDKEDIDEKVIEESIETDTEEVSSLGEDSCQISYLKRHVLWILLLVILWF